jgi:hypothetical protein
VSLSQLARQELYIYIYITVYGKHLFLYNFPLVILLFYLILTDTNSRNMLQNIEDFILVTGILPSYKNYGLTRTVG